jgi:integrase
VARSRADTARVIISSIFTYGIDRGYVSENPATGMRNRHAYLPRDVVASANYIRRLWSAMDAGEAAMATGIATIIRLALVTGQRRTEIAAATKDELDLSPAARLLTIPRGRAKNRNMHRVPLSPQAARLFSQACAVSGESPFVFPGEIAGRPIASRSVSKAMERARTKLAPTSPCMISDTAGSHGAFWSARRHTRARTKPWWQRSGSVTDDVYGWYDYGQSAQR